MEVIRYLDWIYKGKIEILSRIRINRNLRNFDWSVKGKYKIGIMKGKFMMLELRLD